MKCQNCLDFVNNICQVAQQGELSKLEGDCLLRCAVMLLRDIWNELAIRNDDIDEGEDWKYPDE